jgi:rRNA-processing protein FCF1
MKSALLDTSFILTCIRQKIDFFEEIKFQGIQILIPEQVITEIKRISESKKKLRFREEAKLALELLKKSKFTRINLKSKNTDKGISNYSKEHDVIVATLDKELKQKVKGQKLVIRGKKKLEII